MVSTSLTQRIPGQFQRLPQSRATVGYLVGGWAAIAVYFTLAPHAQSVLFVGIGLSAVTAIVIGAARKPRIARLPWHLFSAGILCQVVADAISGYYEIHLNREPPLPSAADAFYLSGYPLLVLGIVVLVRRLGGQAGRAALLDTIIVAVAVATVQWIFFVEAYIREALPLGARIADIAYPSMDVLLLVAFSQLLVGPSGRAAAYRLLVISVALWLIGDEVYGLSSSTYVAGGWLDTFWLGSYVVWGAAALEPSPLPFEFRDRRTIPRLTPARLTLLAAALLTMPSVLLIERTEHHHIHALIAAAGGAGIGVLVLFRLVDLVRAVEGARASERIALQDAEQSQRQLEEQNDRLREVDRLKDEFVSSISHELRTPLTSISGYVELLMEDEKDTEKSEYLDIVDRNATRLLGLVSDMLFAARMQSGQFDLRTEPVDLRLIVGQIVDSIRPEAEAADVDLRVHEAGVIPEINGERDRLAQLFDNLLSNAIKFTPRGGQVDISLGGTNGKAVIEVTDTGIGISDEERSHLFERFFRTQVVLDRQIPGTGLGLYISKAIVEAHGGQIAVRSVEGKGTTFVVELPSVVATHD
ncbi:MAG TPA: HAMP domain-containing sensor histidine kinase [Gaiellaceae bacterium]|nr:HAMP domain-containing sensor histidine kinase [Gaiellaceae bacterium]